MTTYKLNVINKSNDNPGNVVIFQKPVNVADNEHFTAWKVIKNLKQGENHPFIYDENLQLSVEDNYGSSTPLIDAQPGQLFEFRQTPAGHVLEHKGPGKDPRAVWVLNSLDKDAIKVLCFRSRKILAKMFNLVPQQAAGFEFLPRIFIGVLSDVEESQVMNSAVVSSINTELSLLGLKSADIVMRGGGTGPDAAFTFTLENTVMS